MSGPEHYREAERLLTEAVSWDPSESQTRTDAVVMAAAQVHATLALTAATAYPSIREYYGIAKDGGSWSEAVS